MHSLIFYARLICENCELPEVIMNRLGAQLTLSADERYAIVPGTRVTGKCALQCSLHCHSTLSTEQFYVVRIGDVKLDL